MADQKQRHLFVTLLLNDSKTCVLSIRHFLPSYKDDSKALVLHSVLDPAQVDANVDGLLQLFVTVANKLENATTKNSEFQAQS